jgi:hypothetical protein
MKEIVIDELEELAARYVPPNEWTDDQIAILTTYWRRVPLNALAKHCKHAREAVDKKAAELGLPPRAR